MGGTGCLAEHFVVRLFSTEGRLYLPEIAPRIGMSRTFVGPYPGTPTEPRSGESLR